MMQVAAQSAPRKLTHCPSPTGHRRILRRRTTLCILAHESREAARKNWSEFEADGKIVEKTDSSFMDPTDYSPIK